MHAPPARPRAEVARYSRRRRASRSRRRTEPTCGTFCRAMRSATTSSDACSTSEWCRRTEEPPEHPGPAPRPEPTEEPPPSALRAAARGSGYGSRRQAPPQSTLSLLWRDQISSSCNHGVRPASWRCARGARRDPLHGRLLSQIAAPASRGGAAPRRRAAPLRRTGRVAKRTPMKVAFLGLGVMGFPMARHLTGRRARGRGIQPHARARRAVGGLDPRTR